MTTIIKTNFGNFQIKLFRFENNEIGYEVYTEPHGDEIYGQYIGEFDPIIKWNEDMDIIEKEIFKVNWKILLTTIINNPF